MARLSNCRREELKDATRLDRPPYNYVAHKMVTRQSLALTTPAS